MSVKTPRFLRFEWQILLAMGFAALVPSALSLLTLDELLEANVALSLHEDVRKQLDDSALLYKRLFDAKKAEYSARAEALSHDALLLSALADEDNDDVHKRLVEIVDESGDIAGLRLVSKGEVLAEAKHAQEGETVAALMSRVVRRPFHGALADKTMEIEFVMPTDYAEGAALAEQIAFNYTASLRAIEIVRREKALAYALFLVVVLAASLVVGYLLSRRVTRRVARLAQATERVAKGDLNFEIPLKGRDEITELTGAFNRMIGEISDARDRIVYLEKVSGWQEFARRLAHEIKNPLTPIQLAVQELRRRTPDTDLAYKKLVDDASDVVEEEIASLTRLVDEFSQFARLPEVVRERVELRGFLEDFLSAYNRFSPDAVVETELLNEEVFVMIDRVLMRRVLANLAKNAIEAAGAGRAQLRLTVHRGERDEVELRMSDNGPGVAREMVARVFDPYFTTKPDGTGLGLAIVKKIVLQHGGNIFVEEQATPGATFVIRLPTN